MSRSALSYLRHIGRVDRHSLVDDDGACSVCDHPFGDMAHACLASGSAASSYDLVAID